VVVDIVEEVVEAELVEQLLQTEVTDVMVGSTMNVGSTVIVRSRVNVGSIVNDGSRMTVVVLEGSVIVEVVLCAKEVVNKAVRVKRNAWKYILSTKGMPLSYTSM
jgi:hypothetical protein